MYQQNVVYKILAIMVWWLLSFAAWGANNDATNLPRMALVIGNANYRSDSYNLANPVKDAKSLATALRRLNFEVTQLENLTQYEMQEAISNFSLRLYEKRGVGLFYFSGHGMQYLKESYLIPVDSMVNLKFAQQLPKVAISESWVLATLEGSGSRMNIVLLDACRDNSLPATVRGKLSAGLAASSSPPKDFIIGYAAAGGDVAKDGDGNNSPYVTNLLSVLREPGLNVEAILKRVRKGVMTDTNDVQQPQFYHALTDEFVFNPSAVGTEQVVRVEPVVEPPPVVIPPVRKSFEPEMVTIPGGSFMMGSPEGTGDSDEHPQHEVTVAGFSMGKYEVTQGEWQALMASNPSNFSSCGERCPVENVSWDDVQVYIKKLNAQTGKTYRLPSEAEWEYACRGGVTGDTYCGGNDVDSLAWYSGNSDNKTHAVGGKSVNGFGLFDMSGNVWEFTCSEYDSAYSSGKENRCVKQGNNTRSTILLDFERFSARAVRGGSWYVGSDWVRAANRYDLAPSYRSDRLGFRLVQD